MDRWLTRAARVTGTAFGAMAGVVGVQYLRLRRMTFLPPYPGFDIDHTVTPSTSPPGAREAEPIRLAVFGDSTTAGVGVDRPEDALPYQLAQRIAEAEGRVVHVVNYGWAGARAGDLATTQVPRAIEAPFLGQADIVAVVIGSNDATHRTSPRQFRAALRQTFATVRGGAPRAIVVHAGIPRFRGALRTLEPLMFITDHYARLLRPIGRAEAALAGVAYADLARDVPPRIRGRTDILSTDRFHPAAPGYAAWADVIADALSHARAMAG